ncbi:Arginine-hydroxylase NDUFAF5, mitochondrial [Pseudocercospora fuligena]|uniref:Arginine-hydroxylase NDUFAF5, mitochondrial n=1 Tax=Pseudocercospora fuligena TaxID=685502 RepID=A0A8H6R3G1_9PEZI|nr:Arginine-hydroxylase NDUFAF5, mitochondrial [Pseudocercospora fuligena]
MPETFKIQLTERDEKFQKYFTALAPSYAHLTSNTTRLVASAALDLISLPTDADAIIHDNACGPGTATKALITKYQTQNSPIPKIIATDYTPAMISAFESNNAKVTARIADSQSLPFSDETFALSICNISVANFNSAELALEEIHRTLKPDGIAVVTNWKVFGLADAIAEARTKMFGVQGSSPEVAGEEFMKEGFIAEKMVEAGFEEGKVRTESVRVVASEKEDLKGAVQFLTGGFVPIVANLDGSEKGRWKECVEEVLEERKQRDGGIVCEAWVVIAKK